MNYRSHNPDDASLIESLFTSVFTKSESESEGLLIGKLSRELIAGTDVRDLYGFVAVDDARIVGAIFFSRLTFENAIDVFILGPVAIHSDHQGQGVGQSLINYGLGELKKSGVSIVITYGDPKYYSKVDFQLITEEIIRAPLRLSQPEGWLGQSLNGCPIEELPGNCTCVEALNDPVYW